MRNISKIIKEFNKDGDVELTFNTCYDINKRVMFYDPSNVDVETIITYSEAARYISSNKQFKQFTDPSDKTDNFYDQVEGILYSLDDSLDDSEYLYSLSYYDNYSKEDVIELVNNISAQHSSNIEYLDNILDSLKD